MLITCKECKNEISSKADSCPHCGAPRSVFMGDTPPASSGVMSLLGRNIRWVVALVAVLVLVFSKPTEADFERKLRQDIMLALAQQEIKKEDDIVTGLFKLGCSLSRAECADLIRNQMVVKTSDYIIAMSASAHSRENTRSCFGILKNWWCWNTPRKPASSE